MRIAGRFQNMNGGWLDNNAQVVDNTVLALGVPFYTSPQPLRGPSMDKYPGQEQTVIRWTTVWEPSDNFQAKLKLFYSDNEQNESGVTILWSCADGVGSNPYYGAGPVPVARSWADLYRKPETRAQQRFTPARSDRKSPIH